MGLIRPTSGRRTSSGSLPPRLGRRQAQGRLHARRYAAVGKHARQRSWPTSADARRRRPQDRSKRAERFDLDSPPLREYSSGNKKKLGIVLASCTSPTCSSSTSHWRARPSDRRVYKLVGETRDAEPRSFVFAHLSEVEHTCDRVGIIRSGRLVKVADLDEIQRIRLHRLELEFSPDAEVPELRSGSAAGVEDVVVSDHSVTCTVNGAFDHSSSVERQNPSPTWVSHGQLEEIFSPTTNTTRPPKP